MNTALLAGIAGLALLDALDLATIAGAALLPLSGCALVHCLPCLVLIAAGAPRDPLWLGLASCLVVLAFLW